MKENNFEKKLQDIELILKEFSIPVNIEKMIYDKGIELNKNYLEFEANISGEIKKENNKFIININGADHYYRKRFTMAHELAHFILHKDLIGDGVDDSLEYKKFYRKNNKINDEHESQANDLASKILMPEEAMIKLAKLTDVIKLNNGDVDINIPWLEYLSKKFQVSKRAFTVRLARLSNKILQTQN